MPRVVIVGAGFGGLEAAKKLANKPVQVTLVDQRSYHSFQPLLYQVATAGLAPDDIATSVRAMFLGAENVDARRSRVEGIDLESRELAVAHGPPVPYDYLILAAGSVSSDFGVPGVAEHALTLKTIEDAVCVRKQLLGCLEETATDPSLGDAGHLTVVVVGGGSTGVELAGAMAEWITAVLPREFKHLDVNQARVILVEGSDHLLGAFSQTSQDKARGDLIRRGVEVRTGVAIHSVSRRMVTLADGSTIAAGTIVWAAGIKANPLGSQLGVDLDRSGRVPITDDLSLAEHSEVFIIGDLAATPGRDGTPLPQVAQVAIQGAAHVTRSILDRLQDRPLPGTRRRFHYVDKGAMATIGRRSAVVELPGGIHLAGTFGWLIWLCLHIVYIAGFHNRLVVFVKWAWMYTRWGRADKFLVEERD